MFTNKLTAAVMTMGLMTGAAALTTGCTNQTESERTRDKAGRLDQSADTLARGEKMVRDGEATIARGKTLKQQGDMSGGDRVIAEGESMKKQGEALISQGRKMKM